MTTFIEGRQLRVTLVSASNIPDIREFGRMKVYAEVSLNEDKRYTMKSSTDRVGESNPRWNFVATYSLSEQVVQHPGVNLVVKLWCERTLGEKYIGKVIIPIKNLFDGAKEDANKILSYSVEGTPGGMLCISYSFGEKMALDPNPSPPARRLPSWMGDVVTVLTLIGFIDDPSSV